MGHCTLFQTDGTLLAQITDYERLEWTRSYTTPGVFRMEINQNKVSVDKVKKGLLLGVAEFFEHGGLPGAQKPDNFFRIETLDRKIEQEGTQSEILVMSGRSFSGFFGERIIIPPATQTHDEILNVPAETAMKHYVKNHAGANASANRQFPNFKIATDQARGINVSVRARFQPLVQILEQIGLKAQRIGYEIDFDTNTNEFIFDVIVGTDHTTGTTNPVLFDVDLESILSQQWITSDLGRKNFALVGGSGEGTGRVTAETFIDGTEPTGFDRFEIFIDASDLSDTNDLEFQGESTLERTATPDSMKVRVNPIGPFRYRREWDLGDLVTIRNLNWGLQKNVRIISVTNIFDRNEALMETEIELSKEIPNIREKVRQEIPEVGSRRK